MGLSVKANPMEPYAGNGHGQHPLDTSWGWGRSPESGAGHHPGPGSAMSEQKLRWRLTAHPSADHAHSVYSSENSPGEDPRTRKRNLPGDAVPSIPPGSPLKTSLPKVYQERPGSPCGVTEKPIGTGSPHVFWRGRSFPFPFPFLLFS